MSIDWILVIFFCFVTFAFIIIAVIFPEFVGITGKKNQQYYQDNENDGVKTTESPKASEEPPQ